MNFLQWFKGLLSVFDLNAIQFPGSRNTGLITQEAAYLNNNAGLGYIIQIHKVKLGWDLSILLSK